MVTCAMPVLKFLSFYLPLDKPAENHYNWLESRWGTTPKARPKVNVSLFYLRYSSLAFKGFKKAISSMNFLKREEYWF